MPERKKATYSKEFKEKAARLYLEGKGSYRQLCDQLGIKDKKSLRCWVAKSEWARFIKFLLVKDMRCR